MFFLYIDDSLLCGPCVTLRNKILCNIPRFERRASAVSFLTHLCTHIHLVSTSTILEYGFIRTHDPLPYIFGKLICSHIRNLDTGE